MFGPIGGWEVILVLLLALLLFGPRKLPELGRTFGRTLAQLRRAATEFRTDLEKEIRVEELQDAGQGLKAVHRDVAATVSDVRRAAREAVAPESEPSDRETVTTKTSREEPTADGDAGASTDDR